MRKSLALSSRLTAAALTLAGLAVCGAAAAQTGDDPFLWLEDVQGEKALSWVKEHNAKSTALLEARKEYKPIYARTLEILDSKENIPLPELHGETVYNFWKDDAHERGLWRRTSLASYRTAAPAVGDGARRRRAREGGRQGWVWHGADCLPPANARCLVKLSPGGSDAAVVREFDTKTKQFVAGGFALPEAKSPSAGGTRTRSGSGRISAPARSRPRAIPRIVKLWKRGTPLSEAKPVFEGKPEDVAASGNTEILSDGRYDVVTRTPAFFRDEAYLYLGGRLVQDRHARGRAAARVLPRPDPHLPAQRLDDRRQDVPRRAPFSRPPSTRCCAAPAASTSSSSRASACRSAGVERTKDRVLIQTLDNVRSRVTALALEDGAWKRSEVATARPRHRGVHGHERPHEPYFFRYQDYSSPTSLWLAEKRRAPAKVKSMPAFFDATGVKTEQFEAVVEGRHEDPVLRRDARRDSRRTGPPRRSSTGTAASRSRRCPRYSGTIGAAWISRGGVFVVANIRGGGEFGPAGTRRP